jgi:short-subunit dehydrogenase
MATIAQPNRLAVVTGASSGIGRNLARIAAENGFDLIIGADTELDGAAREFRSLGREVTAIQGDFATKDGVDRLLSTLGNRTPDALFANAGHGLGGAFLDQPFADVQHVIDTNITGTIYLLQQVAREMKMRGKGRILVTGSIAGFMPGSFQAVYNGTKAFIDSFSLALRDELKGSGVTVSCLMPGVTDTHFFERAGMEDTQVGASDDKMDPAQVARIGFDAMMDGEADVIAGWKNKLQVALSNITPGERLAAQHRKIAEPGSAHH